MHRNLRLPLLTAFAGLAAACGSDGSPITPLSADLAATSLPGAVAVASNEASANAVLVYARHADGSLEGPRSYPTGGAGTGAGVGNQGGLTLSGDRRFLLAVNPGSNDVTVFGIGGSTLSRIGHTASGGQRPISVTEHAGVVYVLNAGGTENITGFRLGADGSLTPIAGAVQPLSGTGVAPAQVSFSPDGSHLVVTEKGTNLITVYNVDGIGVAGPPQAQASSGATPFGFAFDPRGRLVVSEAFGGAPDASAVSSYAVRPNGTLQVRSGTVGTTETAACWVAITPDGRYAYVTNTGSSSVTGYRLNGDAALSILTTTGATGHTGATPIDLAITPDGRRLYTLDSGSHQLSRFGIRPDGRLEAGPATSGLPPAASGMVAW